MSANKVFTIANKIEKLRNKKILEDEKHKKAQLYYQDQITKTKEKYQTELAYWEQAQRKSVISNLRFEKDILDKHHELLKELDEATKTPKSIEALKEVVDRVRSYSYKDTTDALLLLKE